MASKSRASSIRSGGNESLLFQPIERPGHPASLVHGLQHVIGSIGAMAATASIVAISGGQPDDYLAWLPFASMVVCGVGRILQTFQIWQFGSGHTLIVTSGSTFIAVCITALAGGGPAMISSLTAASALIQFAFISKLSLIRRFITPTVAGTVLMLMSATIISVVQSRLPELPEGAPSIAAPALAGITLAVLMGSDCSPRQSFSSGVRYWASSLAAWRHSSGGCTTFNVWLMRPGWAYRSMSGAALT